MSKEEEFPIIFRGTQIDANFLKGILESEGIKVFLRDEFMASTNPWAVAPGAMAPVKLVVMKKDLEKAKEIVDEFQKKRHKQGNE